MDYEKLGAFYLGRIFDHKAQETTGEPLLYDAKDLCTHAVCVGMTGSGKTGLCISLLEEAAIDGIPAIAIDPKGDLGNLMLTFPKLSAEEFEPWIDKEAAARRGESTSECAASTAGRWREGLAEWGQGPERIAKLRAATEVCIYTPGSSAGRSLTVLRSFAPPAQAIVDDSDAFRELVSTTTSGLLALLGIAGDPLRSREHILIATILKHAWEQEQTLDLAGLIGAVQDPPVERIGVVSLEQFYPKKDRVDLAMSINGILASPSFSGWLEGEPLDIKKLLWTDTGKPRISILNIAHLSEAERMFFVTILLNEMVAWMRTQSGTSSLRALLYMDEVFGFFPPVANPPSKRPMLTLLKQARAYGLGVMLSTQNPVDLDYKGLANTGTWFIGRMQTERDVARVVDGLEGAANSSGTAFNRREITTRIAGLGDRVFLMNNVHEDAPVSFKTRWALSYLRGPLTRDHIRALMPKPKRSARPVVAPAPKSAPAPSIDAEIKQRFAGDGSATAYTPHLYGSVELHFVLAAKDIDEWTTVHCQAVLKKGGKRSPWKGAELSEKAPVFGGKTSEVGFASLPTFAGEAKSYAAWAKALKTYVYKECTLTLYKCTPLKMTSHLGEDETDFRVRVRDAVREKRDLKMGKLRTSYGKKLLKLRGQIERAEQRLGKEEMQLGQAKTNTALSAGTTVLGALFGRKVASIGNVSRMGTTARRAGKIRKESQDVAHAQEKLAGLRTRLDELEMDFQEKLSGSSELVSTENYPITTKVLRPRKADIEVGEVALLWLQAAAS